MIPGKGIFSFVSMKYIYIYIYIYIVLFGPVKPELGVIPSGQKKKKEKKEKHSTVNI